MSLHHVVAAAVIATGLSFLGATEVFAGHDHDKKSKHKDSHHKDSHREESRCERPRYEVLRHGEFRRTAFDLGYEQGFSDGRHGRHFQSFYNRGYQFGYEQGYRDGRRSRR